MRTLFSVLVPVSAVAFLCTALPGEVQAKATQPRAGAKEKRDPGKKAQEKGLKIKKTKTGENELETFDIVGKIYKPEVFVFLGRKKLNLDWDLADPRFKRSFLERIIRSVWDKPF